MFEAIAQGEGAAFVSGNGTKKPTGFLAGPTPVTTTDASRAFGTLQYIFGGQAAALPTSLDPLYDLVYGLRARYRRNARWVGGKLVFAGLELGARLFPLVDVLLRAQHREQVVAMRGREVDRLRQHARRQSMQEMQNLNVWRH